VDTIVFGDYTVLDLIIAAVVILIAFNVFAFLKKLLTKKEAKPYAQSVKCYNCGWEGHVSKHAGKCPKCNTALGDQQLRNY